MRRNFEGRFFDLGFIFFFIKETLILPNNNCCNYRQDNGNYALSELLGLEQNRKQIDHEMEKDYRYYASTIFVENPIH